MVGSGADYSNFNSVLRIPASEGVYDVDILACVEVVDCTVLDEIMGVGDKADSPLTVDLEDVLRHSDVDGSPPDVVH